MIKIKRIGEFKENLNISDNNKLYTKEDVIKMLDEVANLSFIDGVKVGKSGGKVGTSNFTLSEWIENNL
jgi:hypothetical protein